MRPRALRGAAAAAADRIISVLLRVALSSVACALTILAWRDKKSISGADGVFITLSRIDVTKSGTVSIVRSSTVATDDMTIGTMTYQRCLDLASACDSIDETSACKSPQ